MIDKKAIGKIIKTLRTNKKITQEELAEKIDISKNYLSKVERGLSVLNAESFLKMASILNFSLEDFGINNSSELSENKKRLIEQVLSYSEKEATAYLELLNTMSSIRKILK